MVESLGVAEAKRRFAELIDRVRSGERFVVHRRGKPAVGLVPPNEATEAPPRYLGLAAFAGALADVWPEMEEDMVRVVASRRKAKDRPAPELD